MKMTIDEARNELISGKPYTDKFAMALVVAIDTMRNYKRVEQIANDKNINGDLLRMSEIRSVLEDGD